MSKSEKDAIKAAVQRGVRWLDRHRPGWENLIDPETLDLGSPCRCVLGQLDGDFFEASWAAGLSKAGTARLGLSAPQGASYPSLTAAWKRVIRARQRKAHA
ncbi:MAG TPA: hypothetical protein VNL18_15640 [Gemmatimonadales bacterium]|nr:hypothetical protein [Gemmatimonadales bacterium]